MSSKNTSNIINVYGDTLDSCVYSRVIAERYPEKTIVHYSSGNYGGIYSDTNRMLGLLTEKQVNKILEYLPLYDFIQVTETYVKVPHSKLKFKNTTDGNLRFPFTKKTFECEYDYNDVITSTPSFEEYMEDFKENKNIVKVMKSIFNDAFYMDISKKIGTNIFNIIQSKLDAKYLYKSLFGLEYLQYSDYIVQYTPTNGYYDLCCSLLSHSNITRVVDTHKNIKEKITLRRDSNYVFDYFDYYFDFIFGGIEYTKFTPIEYKKTFFNTDFITKIYTPYDKKFGIYFQIEDTIYSVENKPYYIRSNNVQVSIPTPSQSNYKKILQYVELVNNMPNVKIMF